VIGPVPVKAMPLPAANVLPKGMPTQLVRLPLLSKHAPWLAPAALGGSSARVSLGRGRQSAARHVVASFPKARGSAR
jgi:hypothetical protein